LSSARYSEKNVLFGFSCKPVQHYRLVFYSFTFHSLLALFTRNMMASALTSHAVLGWYQLWPEHSSSKMEMISEWNVSHNDTKSAAKLPPNTLQLIITVHISVAGVLCHAPFL